MQRTLVTRRHSSTSGVLATSRIGYTPEMKKSRAPFIILASALLLILLFEATVLSFDSPKKRTHAFTRYSRNATPPVASLVNKKVPAIITLVGGDDAARHAVAMIQSLKAVNTQLHVVVLLGRGGVGSANCQNHEWKQAHNRTGIYCGGPDTVGA
jgi:hypothetical protein